MNLVPVKESPLNKNTAYKYHSLKKYPALLFKVAGRLMVDMDEYNNMAKQAREAQIKEAQWAIFSTIGGPVVTYMSPKPKRKGFHYEF